MAYPRCFHCRDIVHPVFDWADDVERYVCDQCEYDCYPDELNKVDDSAFVPNFNEEDDDDDD